MIHRIKNIFKPSKPAANPGLEDAVLSLVRAVNHLSAVIKSHNQTITSDAVEEDINEYVQRKQTNVMKYFLSKEEAYAFFTRQINIYRARHLSRFSAFDISRAVKSHKSIPYGQDLNIQDAFSDDFCKSLGIQRISKYTYEILHSQQAA